VRVCCFSPDAAKVQGNGKTSSPKPLGKQLSLCKWSEEASPDVEFVIDRWAKRD
jgi:hypothetical protein